MNLVIRSFQDSDTATAQVLIGELQAHELPLQSHLLPWKQVRESYWTWLSTNLKEKSGFMYLAEVDSQVVELTAGYIDEDYYPAAKSDEVRYGYVAELVVLPSARERGVGTELMRAAEKFFIQNNIKSMKLFAWANNTLADQFYVNYGMQRSVTIYKKYLIGVA